jgi:hypothetical protein
MRLRFGVSVIYDPRCRISHDLLGWASVFYPVHGCIIRYDRARRGGDRLDYRFDITKPLEPQIKNARDSLLRIQAEIHGKKNTPRPRKLSWPLFLRALDARDCEATYAEMASTFWPGLRKTEQSARDTYEQAARLRDNFPI